MSTTPYPMPYGWDDIYNLPQTTITSGDSLVGTDLSLNSLLNGAGGGANTNNTITQDMYNKIKVALPDYSDAQILNLITNAPWLAGLITDGATQFSDPKQMDSLETYLNYAQDQANAAKDYANATLQEQARNTLNNIARDTVLLENIQNQRLKDAAEGVTVGSRAANAQKTVAESSADYKKAADEMQSTLAEIPAALREAAYTPFVSQFENYTAQQVAEALRQENIRRNNIDRTGIALDLLRGATENEIDAATRKTNENTTASDVATSAATAQASAQNTAAIAKQDAYLSWLMQQLDPILSFNTNTQYDTPAAAQAAALAAIAQAKTNVANTGNAPNYDVSTGTFVNPNLIGVDTGKIDESVYNALLSDPTALNTLLGQEAYNAATERAGLADLADKYGLDFLKSQEATTAWYDKFANQAITEADRTFNQAQKAYIAALAAGDTKTIEQLTRLANTASVNKRGLYDASTLAQQYKQQQLNANVGNTMAANYQRHLADNAALQAQAKAAAQKAYATQTGYSSTQDTFGNVQGVHNDASNTGYGSYAGTALTGMQQQSAFNDLVSNANQTTNSNLTNLADNLTQNNATAAANNTQNNATVAGIKDKFDLLNKMAKGQWPQS